MLMDISSELTHSLPPMFMVTTLDASAFMVGLVEGLGESTALIVKIFSGVLSDYLGKRKGLAVLGYSLGRYQSRCSQSRQPLRWCWQLGCWIGSVMPDMS
jgi:hypothetical protein